MATVAHDTPAAELDCNVQEQVLATNAAGPRIKLCTFASQPGDDIISCNLEPASFNDPELKYKCLSCVWGSQDNQEMILLDGKQHRVRRNLPSALRMLKNVSFSSSIWIDAICINQADDEEKR